MYTNQRLQIVDIPTLVDEPPIFSRQVRNVLAVLLHDQSPPLAIGLYGPARDIIDTLFMTRYWLALDSVLAAVRLKLLMDARDIIPVSATQTRPGQEARLRDALIPVHRAFELSLFQLSFCVNALNTLGLDAQIGDFPPIQPFGAIKNRFNTAKLITQTLIAVSAQHRIACVLKDSVNANHNYTEEITAQLGLLDVEHSALWDSFYNCVETGDVFRTDMPLTARQDCVAILQAANRALQVVSALTPSTFNQQRDGIPLTGRQLFVIAPIVELLGPEMAQTIVCGDVTLAEAGRAVDNSNFLTNPKGWEPPGGGLEPAMGLFIHVDNRFKALDVVIERKDRSLLTGLGWADNRFLERMGQEVSEIANRLNDLSNERVTVVQQLPERVEQVQNVPENNRFDEVRTQLERLNNVFQTIAFQTARTSSSREEQLVDLLPLLESFANFALHSQIAVSQLLGTMTTVLQTGALPTLREVETINERLNASLLYKEIVLNSFIALVPAQAAIINRLRPVLVSGVESTNLSLSSLNPRPVDTHLLPSIYEGLGGLLGCHYQSNDYGRFSVGLEALLDKDLLLHPLGEHSWKDLRFIFRIKLEPTFKSSVAPPGFGFHRTFNIHAKSWGIEHEETSSYIRDILKLNFNLDPLKSLNLPKLDGFTIGTLTRQSDELFNHLPGISLLQQVCDHNDVYIAPVFGQSGSSTSNSFSFNSSIHLPFKIHLGEAKSDVLDSKMNLMAASSIHADNLAEQVEIFRPFNLVKSARDTFILAHFASLVPTVIVGITGVTFLLAIRLDRRDTHPLVKVVLRSVLLVTSSASLFAGGFVFVHVIGNLISRQSIYFKIAPLRNLLKGGDLILESFNPSMVLRDKSESLLNFVTLVMCLRFVLNYAFILGNKPPTPLMIQFIIGFAIIYYCSPFIRTWVQTDVEAV